MSFSVNIFRTGRTQASSGGTSTARNGLSAAQIFANEAYDLFNEPIRSALSAGHNIFNAHMSRDETKLSLETAEQAVEILRQRFTDDGLRIIDLYADRACEYAPYTVGVVVGHSIHVVARLGRPYTTTPVRHNSPR